MGLVFLAVLVDIFMTDYEIEVIDSSLLHLKCWHRYVNSVFAVWPLGPAVCKTSLAT
jgi:hypothetical protein